MPTVRQKLDAGIAAGVAIEKLKSRMSELGIQKEDMELDYNTAKARGATRLAAKTVRGALPFISDKALAPTEDVAGVPVQMMPTPASVAETPDELAAARELAAIKPLPKSEFEPLDLPEDDTTASEQQVGTTRYRTVGGLMRHPLETTQFAGGAAVGLGKTIGKSVIGDDEQGKKNFETMKATGDEVRATRERRLKDGIVSSISDDVLTSLGGLASMIGSTLAGVVIEEDDTEINPYASGKKMGEAIVPAMAAQTIEALAHPFDTTMSAPFTTAMTMLPFLRSGLQTAKATGIPGKIANSAKVAQFNTAIRHTAKNMKVVNAVMDIAERYSPGIKKMHRALLDAYEADSPQATIMLDEMLVRTRALDEAFSTDKRAVTAKVPEPTAFPELDGFGPDSRPNRFFEQSASPEFDGFGPDSRPNRFFEQSASPEFDGFGPDSRRAPGPELIDIPDQALGPELIDIPDQAFTERLGKRSRLTEKTPEPIVRDIVDEAPGQATIPENLGLFERKTVDILRDIGDDVVDELRLLQETGSVRGAGLQGMNRQQLAALVKDTVVDKLRQMEATKPGIIDKFLKRKNPDSGRVALINSTLDDIKTKLKASVKGQVLDAENDRFFGVNKITADAAGMSEFDNAINKLATAAPDETLPSYIRVTQPKVGQKHSKDAIVKALTEKLNNPSITEAEKIAVNRAIKHVKRLEMVQDFSKTSVSGFVDPGLKGMVEIEKAAAIGGLANQLLSQLPKTVALPANPKAIINNIIGNEVLSSLAFGDLPGRRFAQALISKGKEWISGLSAEEASFMKSARKTGIFNTNQIKADIRSTELLSAGELGMKGLETATEVLGRPGGYLMSKGDEIYRLPGAYKEWQKAKYIVEELEPGQFAKVPVSQNVEVKFVKQADGSINAEFMSKGRATAKKIVNASDEQISDLLARYGKNQMDTFYFDYGRVPEYISALRRAPLIGAGSTFFTWSFKALDIPGFKKGLLSASLAGPTNIVTNSQVGNIKLAIDNAALAIKRAGLLAAIHAESKTDVDMQRMLSYDPKSPSITNVIRFNNPAQLAVGRFSSANFLETQLAVLDLGSQFYERMTRDDEMLNRLAKTDNSGQVDFIKLTKELRDLAVKKRDPIPTALKLVGLSGGLLLQTYTDALDADEQGKAFDLTNFAKVYIPATARAYLLGEGADERFRQVEPGMKPVEDVLDFHIRNAIGMGYQTINTRDQYGRFRKGVQKEMQAQLDGWKYKRQMKLAKNMSQKEAYNKAEEQSEKVKALITSSLEDMDSVFKSKFQVDTAPRQN